MYDSEEEYYDREPCLAKAENPVTVRIDQFSLNDFNEALVASFHSMLAKQVEKTLKKIADKVASQALGDRANEIIEAAITRAIQPTTEFGEPVGAPTTILANLAAAIEAHFQAPVNSEGKTINQRDTWEVRNGTPRLDWMVRKYAVEQVTKQAEAEIKRIGEEAKVKVAEAVAALITEKLAPRIRTT